MKRRTAILAIISISMVLISCKNDSTAGKPQEKTRPCAVIYFDFEKNSGYATNQFAVWIEDETGAFIRTLYATKFTAKGGYKKRPDAISQWVSSSNPERLENIDALTGATPKSGSLEFLWDLKDENGATVSDGSYNFYVEGTLRWSNSVLYSGLIEVGEFSGENTAVPEYFFIGGENGGALNETSPETLMITNVRAEFIP